LLLAACCLLLAACGHPHCAVLVLGHPALPAVSGSASCQLPAPVSCQCQCQRRHPGMIQDHQDPGWTQDPASRQRPARRAFGFGLCLGFGLWFLVMCVCGGGGGLSHIGSCPRPRYRPWASATSAL